MRSRRVFGFAVLLLLVGLIAPSPAAPATNALLIVEGGRNAVVDVTFRDAFELDSFDIRVTGGGKWSALVIEPRVSPGPFSFFAVVRAPAVLGSRLATTRSDTRFPAGSYRIRLLTDRQVTFILSVSRGGRLVLPTKRVDAHMSSGSAALAPGVTNSTTVLARAVGAGRRALLLHDVQGMRYEDTFLCASTSQSCERETVALPSPLPSPEAGVAPSSSPEGYVEPVLATTPTTRGVVFGVRGVRTQAATERALCIDFS